LRKVVGKSPVGLVPVALELGEHYQVKRTMVKQGGRLSLSLHHHRAEHWVVVRCPRG
jgi:mannose-6-phosphate isomerase-like protein (cupin superfamily)